MKIGFIGAGNMASALLSGVLNSGLIKPNEAIISDLSAEKLCEWEKRGVKTTTDNQVIENESDIIIFAVKPNAISKVLTSLNGDVSKIYISIAAGVTLSFLEEKLGKDKKIIRTMPNTPAQVGCGMTVLTPNSAINGNDLSSVIAIFDSIGATMQLPEPELEIATALHGSSPAYVYMMIDAMADAGVRHGLSKANALKLAAKALEGSAKMVMETNVHPEQLKDNVCSPGGTTIAAVAELERTGFRASVQCAIDACIARNREMQQ